MRVEQNQCHNLLPALCHSLRFRTFYSQLLSNTQEFKKKNLNPISTPPFPHISFFGIH